MKTGTRKTLIIAIVFVVLIAAAAAVWFATRPETQVGGKTITVTVTDAEEKSETMTISTDAEYLWDALYPDHIDGTDGEYGKWITAVNGITADENAGEYWLFTKGGEWVDTACDATVIADGDAYEFFIYKY